MTTFISTASVHSIVRAKERASWNEKQAEKNIARALARGKSAEDFTSWEREYLEGESRGNCTAVAYNNFCYIVNENGFCLTLYPLPIWFGKKKQFDGKERIRNAKKYAKYYN